MNARSEASDEFAIELTVNGSTARYSIPARRLLSDFLRDDLGLTGTHVGCEHGVCGACTVLLNGDPVRSCLILAVQADRSEITTIEGVTPPGELSPLQQSLRDHHGLQCGFCTPGIIMTLSGVNPDDYPDEQSLRELLSGNLCRCTGYQNIISSVLHAWGRD